MKDAIFELRRRLHVCMELKACHSHPGADPGDWEPGSHHYSVKLTREGKGGAEFFCFFSTGSGWKHAPNMLDVLGCLRSDASYAEYDFSEWCSELGYDEDSRKAFKSWEAYKDQTARLRAFFVDDWEDFLNAPELEDY